MVVARSSWIGQVNRISNVTSFFHRYQRGQRSRLRMRLAVLLYRRLRRKTSRRSFWVHPILLRRNEQGEYHRLVHELRLERTAYYRRYFRMSPQKFDSLLELVKPHISKQPTVMREPIPPGERLAVTLRYLATGDSYQSIGASYRIDPSTLTRIIPTTCSVIWQCLQPIVMPQPDEEKWKLIAKDFSRLWHFPNCVGAIDGKHVVIQAPPNSGSAFFNYKKSFSIVLLAVVDAQYKFVIVDIGAYGRQSDAGVFSNSNFGKSLLDGRLQLPEDVSLTPNGISFPHVFVGDEAFPLKRCLMRPYSGTGLSVDKRVFNYRLSRARRIVENAFGIMVSRFRIFHRAICLKPSNVDHVIKACTALHNFLVNQPSESTYFSTDGSAHISEEYAVRPFPRVGRPSADVARVVRDGFKEYFMSDGALPWQEGYVTRTV